MRFLSVYCAYDWRISTWRVTGVKPVTCPPVDYKSINLGELFDAWIVYIRMHGQDGANALFGDDGKGNYPMALISSQINDLDGQIIYLEGCNADDMANAFLQAGASAVVGDKDSSYGRRWRIGPSSLIGMRWLDAMRNGDDVQMAAIKAIENKSIKKLPETLRFGLTVFGDEGAKIT